MPRKKKCECPAGLPGWLTTFSDLMSLLLTFFVLLVSFAVFEDNKIKEAIVSLKGALGVLRPSINVITQHNIPFKQVLQSTPRKEGSEDEELKRKNMEIAAKLSQRGLDRTIGSYISSEGIVLVALSPVFFDSGSAKLREDSYETLSLLAEIIDQYNNNARVEGYTSSATPENASQYPTSWELSGARASNIVRYFAEQHGIDPKRLSFAGHGAYKPAVKGKTLQTDYLNDRVEIKLLAADRPSDIESHLNIQHKQTPLDTETNLPLESGNGNAPSPASEP